MRETHAFCVKIALGHPTPLFASKLHGLLKAGVDCAQGETLPPNTLHALGITCDGLALVWIQNAAHNWKNVHEKNDIPEVENIEVRFLDLTPGSYSSKWWDPYGDVAVAGQVGLEDGSVRVKIPLLRTDITVQLSLEEQKRPAQQ